MKLQFRLRTLMIVVTLLAVPCGWIGWQIKVVNERKATLNWIEKLGGIVRAYEVGGQPSKRSAPEWFLKRKAEYPSILAWFGDQPIYYISFFQTQATWADRERVAAMFPEAWVVPEKEEDMTPIDK